MGLRPAILSGLPEGVAGVKLKGLIMKERILQILKRIEWRGPSDYSIGVSTCPYCRRRGGIRKESDLYEGHSESCELNKMIQELSS